MGKYTNCLQCPIVFFTLIKTKKFCSRSCQQKYWRGNTTKGKECQNKYVKSNKGKNCQRKYRSSERGQATSISYRQSEEGKAARKRHMQSEKGKYNKLVESIDYFARFPERRVAYDKVSNALRDGILNKPDRCSKCNKLSDNIQAHHPNGYDGDNALDVQWLCPVCHHEEHEITCNCVRGRKLRESINFSGTE